MNPVNNVRGAAARLKSLSKRGKVAVALSLAVLAGLILMLGGKEPEAPAQPPKAEDRAIAVTAFPVAPARIQSVLTLPGETAAAADVMLSAERGGPVEWIGPEEGDTVAKDEAIAKVDMATLAAELSSARAAYELAAKQAERREELLAQGVLSVEELDQAQNERTSALAALRQAEADYARGQIVTPVSGVVNEIFVDQGEYVSPGTQVAEIVDVSSIEIEIDVPEMDVRFLEPGAAALVSVDAYPGQSWTGRVAYVAYKADTATKTFRVKVVVDNSDGRIRPGMLARVSIVRQVIEDALSVPLHALVDRGGERLVYVVEDGMARARQVELGVIDKDMIQVTAGLVPGDMVITGGQDAVEEGVKVVIR